MNFNTLFGEYTIPTDGVDADWLTKPSKWAISEIQRFILFIGPISSIFDYLTFFIMLYVFNAWTNPALFHSGWFVEGSAVQAYKKCGLPMAPGNGIGYVVKDAEKWAVDPERDASDFDEVYYRKLLDKAWSEVAYSIGPNTI